MVERFCQLSAHTLELHWRRRSVELAESVLAKRGVPHQGSDVHGGARALELADVRLESAETKGLRWAEQVQRVR